MDKLNPWRVGGAVAMTAAIINLVCVVAVYLFPEGTGNFMNASVHGWTVHTQERQAMDVGWACLWPVRRQLDRVPERRTVRLQLASNTRLSASYAPAHMHIPYARDAVHYA